MIKEAAQEYAGIDCDFCDQPIVGHIWSDKSAGLDTVCMTCGPKLSAIHHIRSAAQDVLLDLAERAKRGMIEEAQVLDGYEHLGRVMDEQMAPVKP